MDDLRDEEFGPPMYGRRNMRNSKDRARHTVERERMSER